MSLPDGYFEKVTLDDGREVLEHKPNYDDTFVVRRTIKKTVPPVKPITKVIPDVVAPEPVNKPSKSKPDIK
jgi:hypothetical protein